MLEDQAMTLLSTADSALGSIVIEDSSSGKLFDVLSLLGLLSFTLIKLCQSTGENDPGSLMTDVAYGERDKMVEAQNVTLLPTGDQASMTRETSSSFTLMKFSNFTP